jgi:predicted acyl esterase
MSSPRYRLTPSLQAVICRYILSGGYAHVAAEAAGVPRQVFDRWLARGRARRPKRRYRAFYEAVMEAEAQVRLAAESKALNKDPLAWLKAGPGKDVPDRPGWSNPPKASLPSDQRAANLLLHRETQEMLTTVLRLLAPYPEARAAVAAALSAPEEGEPGA